MSLMRSKFYSKCLGSYVDVNVYVPSVNFFTALTVPIDELYTDEKFPALYLLHGMMDDYDGWLRFSDAESYAELHRVALIMPDGQNGYWVNAKHGLAYYDFVNDELPRWAESVFPLKTGRENRFIAGLSMGGYGAMRHGLANPERYAAIGCFSGTVDITHLDERLRPAGIAVEWDDVFGGPCETLEGTDDDLYTLMAKCRASGKPLPRLYLSTGTDDPFVREMDERFARDAEDAGFDVTFSEFPGAHLWVVWNPSIAEFLEMIDQGA